MIQECDLSETAAKLIIDEIKHFSQKARSKSLVYYGFCPYCRAKAHMDNFRQHAYRTRTFYVIANQMTYSIMGHLPRWKCKACNRTFTEYPNVVTAQRRYTTPQITKLLRRKDTTAMSYRNCVLHVGRPIFHGNAFFKSQQMSDSISVLSYSTLHRWKRSKK